MDLGISDSHIREFDADGFYKKSRQGLAPGGTVLEPILTTRTL